MVTRTRLFTLKGSVLAAMFLSITASSGFAKNGGVSFKYDCSPLQVAGLEGFIARGEVKCARVNFGDRFNSANFELVIKAKDRIIQDTMVRKWFRGASDNPYQFMSKVIVYGFLGTYLPKKPGTNTPIDKWKLETTTMSESGGAEGGCYNFPFDLIANYAPASQMILYTTNGRRLGKLANFARGLENAWSVSLRRLPIPVST